jgi:hypothetical protein
MKKRSLFILLAGLCVSGIACLPEDWDVGLLRREPSYDPFYVAYLERVRSQALTFQVPASEDDEAWTRAQNVLKKYHGELDCSRKLKVSSDRTIESVPSKGKRRIYPGAAYIYQIRRDPLGEETDYSVAYASPPPSAPARELFIKRTLANARIIALYIVSGMIDPRAFNVIDSSESPPAGDLGPERPSAPRRDDDLAPGVPLAEIAEGPRGHPSAGGAQDGLVDLDLVADMFFRRFLHTDEVRGSSPPSTAFFPINDLSGRMCPPKFLA